MIYYPSFEIRNSNWLKFAMLYWPNLSPIIPDAARSHVSDNFRIVMEETDFIVPHSPTDDQCKKASSIVECEISRIVENPSRYRFILGDKFSLEKWKSADLQSTQLYAAKCTYEFQIFLREIGLGKTAMYGVAVHQDIANLFMLTLANIIARETRSSAITDTTGFDKFSV